MGGRQSPPNLSSVILGLDPRIHKPLKRMDPRVKPEDDEGERCEGFQQKPGYKALARTSETETRIDRPQRSDAGKECPCLLLVALHLHDQRIEAVEFQFIAQVAEEGDGGDFAVEVA